MAFPCYLDFPEEPPFDFDDPEGMVAPLPEPPPVDFEPPPLVPEDLDPEELDPLGVDFEPAPELEPPEELEPDDDEDPEEEEEEEEEDEVPLSGEFAPGSTTLPSAMELAVGSATICE